MLNVKKGKWRAKLNHSQLPLPFDDEKYKCKGTHLSAYSSPPQSNKKSVRLFPDICFADPVLAQSRGCCGCVIMTNVFVCASDAAVVCFGCLSISISSCRLRQSRWVNKTGGQTSGHASNHSPVSHWATQSQTQMSSMNLPDGEHQWRKCWEFIRRTKTWIRRIIKALVRSSFFSNLIFPLTGCNESSHIKCKHESK